MVISTLSFTIVLFIALCAALHLWLNNENGFIAGEPISCGSLLFLGIDGMVYPAAQNDTPLGFYIEDSPTTQGNEWNSGEINILEDIKAAMDELNDPNYTSEWLTRQQTLYDIMYTPTIKYWDDLQKEIKDNNQKDN